MPFCAECGKSVKPDAKFCRSCGAPQLDEPKPEPQAPVPAAPPQPLSAPVPPPRPVPPAPVPLAPVQPPAPLCSMCGAPLNPDRKFCGSCGAPIVTVPPVSGPVPVVTPPVPAPVLLLVCASCGNPLSGKEKFCGSCGATVAAPAPLPPLSPIPPLPPVPAPVLVVAPEPVTVPAPSCASCGTPFTGKEKFCGVCGATTNPPQPPPFQQNVVPAPPAGPAARICDSCGKPLLGAEEKFCNACGAPVGSPPPVSGSPAAPSVLHTVAQPVTAPSGETVAGVIGNARKMKMLGTSWDTYALVITDRRMILARLTADRLNAAYKEAAEKAKAEGKGFFGQWADQIALSFQYCERYRAMSPDQTLVETSGNRAIPNERITGLDLSLKDVGKGSLEYHEFRLTISTIDGKFEFLIGEDERFTGLLRQVYGTKVHLPSGYNPEGSVRIKFF